MISLESLPKPLPREWKMDVYLVFRDSEHLGPYIALATSEKRLDNEKLLGKQTVTFTVEDIDIPGIQIEALKKQKQKIIAEAEFKAERIEKQIQSLLAIEYQPDSDGAA